MGVNEVGGVRPARSITAVANSRRAPGRTIGEPQLEMKVAQVRSVGVADAADFLTAGNVTAGPVKCLQVAVQSLHERAVGEAVPNDDDFPPPGVPLACENYRSVRGRIHELAAIRVTSRLRVPIFAQMIHLAKITSVVPAVTVVLLRSASGAAHRIIKPVGSRNDERRGLRCRRWLSLLKSWIVYAALAGGTTCAGRDKDCEREKCYRQGDDEPSQISFLTLRRAGL